MNKIPCSINVMEFEEGYGDFVIRRMAISTKQTAQETMEDIERGGDSTIVMRIEQFYHIFDPLFKSIEEANIQIDEMNKKEREDATLRK